MKRILKYIVKKLIHINPDGIATVSKTIPALKDVSIRHDKKVIYFLKTKRSFALNLLTVDHFYDYALYLHFKILGIHFSYKLPVKLHTKIGPNALYGYFAQSPVENDLIVFESFFGKQYAGNPKYIYEFLLQHHAPYRYVWVYNGKNRAAIAGNPIIVRRGSLEYFNYLAKAGYIVNNIVFPIHNKRKETTYLQTWHGTPLKRLGFDIEVEGPEAEARENFYKESRNWDYLIAQNRYSSEIFKRAFKFEKEVIESGYPHNDIFFANNKQAKISKIKSRLGIPSDKKVILYAPTWRDDKAIGNWRFEFVLHIDLQKWQREIGDTHVILIRMHHLIVSIQGLEQTKGFAYNVSQYDDVQELSLISDILITDYSSVFFDFAVTRKPILFYAYDYEVYAEKLRGFYLDMHEELPGPIVTSETELLEHVRHIEKTKKQFQDRYETFVKRFCYLDDGHASKRVVHKVFKEIHA
jgi:CDP-glycerol glycerophosphotransferase